MNYYERARKFKAKKRLGQNFLIDENCIDTIIDTSEITKDDVVVEIGPGLGFVTEKLVNYAKKVYAIELDEDMVNEISKIGADNLEIIHKDILKTDLSGFGNNLKVVANIPYYITSPILAHLLGETDDLNNKNRKSISQVVLMVQYEVAKRLCANEKSPSKEFGLLSVLAQFWAKTEFIKKVTSRSFYPSPKVDSAILKLTVNDKPLLNLDDYSFFRKVLKACFATRRKNIKNSLMNAGFNKDAVVLALNKLNIDANRRGESLSIFDMGELSKTLKENL